MRRCDARECTSPARRYAIWINEVDDSTGDFIDHKRYYNDVDLCTTHVNEIDRTIRGILDVSENRKVPDDS